LETYLDGNLLTWTVDAMVGLPFTGSAYRAPDGVVVWIDPPDPAEREAELLQLGKPAHIFVTFRDHDRAVDALAAKFGAKVWVPKGRGGHIQKVDVEFDNETILPAGLKAIGMPAVGFGEHALVTEAYGQRFAFIGDAVFNLKGSKVLFFIPPLFFRNHGGPLSLKTFYRGGNTKAAPAQMHQLLDLKLDAVFLSHGAAVPQDADRWLRTALGVS
jgi:hypothetical protein